MTEEEVEKVYKYYHDRYVGMINREKIILKLMDNEDDENKLSFNDYIDNNIRLYEKSKRDLENQLFENDKRLKNCRSTKKMGYISGLLLTGAMFDPSNLYPYIFPGTVYMSLKAKDHLQHNKYSLCKDQHGYVDPVLLKLHKILKGAFICINGLAIYEMKKYYGDDSNSFQAMLILMIIGFAIRIQNKKEDELERSIRRNNVRLRLMEKSLNDLNALKEYEEKEKGASYVK